MKLISLPDYPIPEGAIVGRIRAPDGTQLRFARWLGSAPSRGTVVLLQGRAEFIEKYLEVVNELKARGFGVVAFDWRGQGLSDRLLADTRKGHIESFAQYDMDLATVLERVVQKECAPPFCGLAHSTGATILLRAAAGAKLPMDRLILTSPLIGLPLLGRSAVSRLALRALVAAGLGKSYVPGGRAELMELRPFAGNRRTSDPFRYDRCARLVLAEPALGLGSPTIGWTAAAAEAVRGLAAPGFSERIRAHCLIVASDKDQIVSTKASRAFADRTRSVTYVSVGEGKHELLIERSTIRSQFWAAFDAFLPAAA